MQINFAPVADVDVNPRNPVINTRSFGGDPRNVAQKVVAYARGLEDGGVLSVCKHFPGHGDPEAYVKQKFQGKDVSYEKTVLEDGTIIFDIQTSMIRQRCSFTEI